MNELIDDLVLTNDLDIKPEMSLGEIYQLINESVLKYENWTLDDLAGGKQIHLFPEWKKHAETIIWGYRKLGWNIFWMKEKNKEYFSFQRPSTWK